jgi:hypothetical protein
MSSSACVEFVGIGVSSVVELNLGWAFQWDWLDRLATRWSGIRVLPIVLQCSRPSVSSPSVSGTPLIRRLVPLSCTRPTPKILGVFSCLEQLERPDVVTIDASRRADEVYAAVKRAATTAMARVDDGPDE